MAAPLEERFRTVRELHPEYRVETVQGRIVVNEAGTWQHNTSLFRVMRALFAPAVERGWQIWPNITIHLGLQSDRYVPDLTVVPRSPRLHKEYAVHGDSTLLIVDVVSSGSSYDDYYVKPRGYSPAGVPLYLVVDPAQRTVRLHSEPGGLAYGRETIASVAEPLFLPAPWELPLNIAAFW
ncbi:Uma2 family endonuclease [Nonomuraea sp. PA05]|uniref:Uma2 family endonuclease n=1 Tax=Nonomuraea sp. PA05 TaxID=2604466 RepID=UPI0011D64A34|nr:Uma2 family endonuclease [Nonomuraea sp. PA05]TYB63228.1 Uma2 family endonuclease [Nonomuraea sp. PA05]